MIDKKILDQARLEQDQEVQKGLDLKQKVLE